MPQGTEALERVIAELSNLVRSGKAILSNGVVDPFDLAYLPAVFASVSGIVKAVPELPGELKDLTSAEAEHVGRLLIRAVYQAAGGV